jgi:hypothetical protein
MTQAALEAAGWVFDANTSGSVSGGLLKISSTTGAATKGARLTVSYAGDFDIVAAPIYVTENTSAESSIVAAPFLGIGEATGTGHYIYCTPVGFYLNTIRVHSATTATWAGGTSATTATYSGVPFMYRICRTSGTVYITAGFPGNSLFGTLGTRVPATGDAWFVVTTDSDAATMDVLSLGAVFSSGNAASVYWAFVRRFS